MHLKIVLNLIRIEIPNSVTKINERAFRKCTDLTDVYYNGTKKQWNEINIGNYNDDLKMQLFIIKEIYL